MSTYAVFGMAPKRALELAYNAVKPLRDEAVSDWEARVRAEADKTMDSFREVQLSEKFDAPHFAEQFLEIAKRDGAKRAHIRVHTWNGEMRKGKKVHEWVEYGSSREAAIKSKLGFRS